MKARVLGMAAAVVCVVALNARSEGEHHAADVALSDTIYDARLVMDGTPNASAVIDGYSFRTDAAGRMQLFYAADGWQYIDPRDAVVGARCTTDTDCAAKFGGDGGIGSAY